MRNQIGELRALKYLYIMENVRIGILREKAFRSAVIQISRHFEVTFCVRFLSKYKQIGE